MQTNKEQLVLIQRDLLGIPPDRKLQVILEEVLQAKPYQAIGQGDWEILLDNRRKRRGNNILKPLSNKEGQMEEELNKYYQKGDELRVLVEM